MHFIDRTRSPVLSIEHRALAKILAGVPRRSIHIATNSHGAPWTQDGFRTSWGRLLERLELPGRLVFHGLRKSAVVMLLEAGCTTAEVAAVRPVLAATQSLSSANPTTTKMRT
jgi:hypothetical protein